jgi:hypothetical protein
MRHHTVDGQVTKGGTSGPLHLDVWILEEEEDGVESVAVDGPDIWKRDVSKSSQSHRRRVDVLAVASLGRSPDDSFGVFIHSSERVDGLPLSVISAKVKLALLCKSMFSEYTRVLRARSGSPEKKSVSPRYSNVSLGDRDCEGRRC